MKLKSTVDADAEENRITDDVHALDEAGRKEFYRRMKDETRDPDTYAVLNWFFVLGLHHFYLKHWIHGTINIAAFFLGVACLFGGPELLVLGVLILAVFFVMELWELFRSQTIVKQHNNEIARQVLRQISGR